jgi:hypothetical protein
MLILISGPYFNIIKVIILVTSKNNLAYINEFESIVILIHL